MEHVEGRLKKGVVLYALSTCVWCRRTKKFLQENDIDFSFEDVDLLDGEEKKTVDAEIRKWNPSFSFPTIVINDENSLVGYDVEGLKEKLGL